MPDTPKPHHPTYPTSEPRGGNRVFTREESRAIWGPHPQADWKYKPPKKGSPWWKQPMDER